MPKPPIVFRLMLCSLFLPIIIVLCFGWFMILFYEPASTIDQQIVLGVPFFWIPYALFSLPFVLWLWMFWSGNWRRPVLTAALVYGAVFFVTGMFELVEIRTPPEKRLIHLYGTKGTDVYCNGIHLGQMPLKIRVDELIAKVPEWTTPPEQRWYDDSDLERILCTWIPWDDFRKERFEASRELFGAGNNRNASNTPRAIQARREELRKHDAGCRYWWSYRLGETQMAFLRNGRYNYLNRPFEKESDYHGINPSSFSRSASFHAQLLADVLPELTPEQKNDWDQHVLTHWSLLSVPLRRGLQQAAARHRRDKNEVLAELYDAALHSTARLKYGISDPPTEEECRRLLTNWVAESIEGYDVFNFWSSSDNRSPRAGDNTLIPADINELMRIPLIEQWRKSKYRSENGWAPVAYFSWQNKSPDYFADFARWSATTGNARIALLDNEAPETVALFKTLLYRRDLPDTFTPQVDLYWRQINTFAQVSNPLVEADFREYVVNALSDPKHNEPSRGAVVSEVMNVIFQRSVRQDIDKDEFSAWVASLPLPASSKNLALRTLRIRSDTALTFADQLQQAAGQNALIETELTLDDVVKWFAENPDDDNTPSRGVLYRFLDAQEDNITITDTSTNRRNYDYTTYSDVGFFGSATIARAPMNNDVWNDGKLPPLFVLALIRSDTPEGDPRVRELIRRIWKHNAYLVESAIITEYGAINLGWDGQSELFSSVGSVYLPEYILDLYLSPENVTEVEAVGVDGKETVPVFMGGARPQMASTLAFCESPKAGEILERWFNGAYSVSMPQAERYLEIWRTRSSLRQMKMGVFQDLIAGRIVPDDLLPFQPPWVWKEGKYVQEPE